MEQSTTYIDCILPVPLNQLFTYHVSATMEDKVVVGCRAIVQFGDRKFYSAIIKRIHTETPNYETKPIELVLDESPIVSNTCFAFWEWIAGYYLSSEGEVMNAALPSGLKLESKTTVNINTDWLEDEQQRLSPTEASVYEFVAQQKKASIQQINSLTKRKNAYPVIKTLLQKRAIAVEEPIDESYRPKTIAHVKVSPALPNAEDMERVFDELKKAGKQLELMMVLLHELNYFSPQRKPSIPKKELLLKSKSTDTILNGLVKKGILLIEEIETDRLANLSHSSSINKLNAFQEKALNEVYACFRTKNTTLLHGVTASGKTEIYVHLINEQLKAGKQVLYLLPEIALTSQIINRLTTVFGSKAGVYHSKFNDSERVEIWNKVLGFGPDNNKYQLILGARSSLFLPFSQLGLIIVDEEHENSFKQYDPSPRYHARDAAIVLGNLHGAKVLLGSATPSFESYFNAKAGKYGLVNLFHRHHNVEPPEIVVADLRDAYKRKKMKANLTPSLFAEIETALANNEQVLLFQNRRGFSPFVQCRACGAIPKCKHCDVSLTYHKFHNNLQCHYCGYSEPVQGNCQSCGSTDVQNKGFGTEKVEDDLGIYFPNVKVGRLDLDASRTKLGYQQVLEKFASCKTQILVGTQMVTKGLDFENVSVVGILNADNLLNYPDFRSYERAYQLMAQVSGRAGRKNKKGKVIIQTSQPEHPVISLVQQNNYEGLFNSYINERKLFYYPPWFRLINITLKHKNPERAQAAAQQLATELKKKFKGRVLGPEFHLISRMQQYYQMVVRIKMERALAPSEAKQEIIKAVEITKQKSLNSTVIINFDVDPY